MIILLCIVQWYGNRRRRLCACSYQGIKSFVLLGVFVQVLVERGITFGFCTCFDIRLSDSTEESGHRHLQTHGHKLPIPDELGSRGLHYSLEVSTLLCKTLWIFWQSCWVLSESDICKSWAHEDSAYIFVQSRYALIFIFFREAHDGSVLGKNLHKISIFIRYPVCITFWMFSFWFNGLDLSATGPCI